MERNHRIFNIDFFQLLQTSANLHLVDECTLKVSRHVGCGEANPTPQSHCPFCTPPPTNSLHLHLKKYIPRLSQDKNHINLRPLCSTNLPIPTNPRPGPPTMGQGSQSGITQHSTNVRTLLSKTRSETKRSAWLGSPGGSYDTCSGAAANTPGWTPYKPAPGDPEIGWDGNLLRAVRSVGKARVGAGVKDGPIIEPDIILNRPQERHNSASACSPRNGPGHKVHFGKNPCGGFAIAFRPWHGNWRARPCGTYIIYRGFGQ
jgi:hypothetical protein